MKYMIETSSKFKKDVKLIEKRGYNLELLKKTIDILANGEQLPESYKDHPLKGDYFRYRECHIQPDWLLIYRIEKDVLVLVLSRTGTHSDLF
ncbi:type II toxin-antitoxin system YafQ family toxin [Sedimentibacter sp.]|uniref:type II toxin-antitoxin system YafQ family toxin n=1 Tax=Sedimentibacter sp. TaxID=1960295 RepID=UPI0028AFFC06|nr:type II toxin-antitoxin system YafQ family toxin [Sedimentibacter sp.]